MARAAWTLPGLLSAARMRPYFDATGGSWSAALALYDWNAQISSAFFESLHYLEVGLRNAFDTTLTEQVGDGWLSTSSGVLTPRSQHAVTAALAHAGGSDAPRGKVIAELPFGFWWSLLSDEYNRRLWQPALRFAFEGPVRRRRLHAELDDLRRLRNRIAHHEPIHTRVLADDRSRLIDVAGRISVELRAHIATTSRIPEVLRFPQRLVRTC